MNKVLEIENLKTLFHTRNGTVKAVDGVDLTLNRGDTLGIVGESGSGKTVLALSIMRLIQQPPGEIAGGRILFEGTDLLKASEEEMRSRRGKDISMIFQEPMNSLNPVIKIGDQIAEAIRLHQHLSKKDAMEKAADMLRRVGMPSPEDRLKNYPHQMSGGMRQRVMIAMALSCNPRLMLADEPTTALDVTIQAQILALINRLKADFGSSVIMITHDLGVIAEATQHCAVMYAGKIVEYCSVEDLFSSPFHPYTEGLMASSPRLDAVEQPQAYLKVIPGSVPNLYDLPPGCSFQDRCPRAKRICKEKEPSLTMAKPGHCVRCWKSE
ncbi:MAG: ABC transporter ATP-binding protein [Syntrophales bacterium]|jgi:oligopeptide/dipeptide ABC transporter ATP-binding protein|nr:ABC transporter ATP-binding protein [Syntrophales bacterium]MDY0044502.1 ABC transporter ATP-binding protein [Syntrophales bacterium]